MSEKPISPLRRRMIEDMTLRNFVAKTRDDYIRQLLEAAPGPKYKAALSAALWRGVARLGGRVAEGPRC
jgi:hypothetical protein